MRTSPALDAALSADVVTIFTCAMIELPGYTIRLLECAGEVTFAEGTFRGSDDRFGSIAGVDAISDGLGEQAPQMSFTLLPPDETASADLSSPLMQGSRVRAWIGAIDKRTGFVVADPYLLFEGELDQPLLTIDTAQRELEYDCVSAFERLFSDEEGIRLSDTGHQEYWPGETGLSDVNGVVRQSIWGPGEKISPSYSYNSGLGGGFDGYDSGSSVRNF